MTLQQFIEKYSLLPMRLSGAAPLIFLTQSEDGKTSPLDKYEFYADADKTIWVSVNQTEQLFRICFCDLAYACSEWLDIQIDQALKPVAAEPLHRA